MAAKVKIDRTSGLLEIEGTEPFIREILDKYDKEILSKPDIKKQKKPQKNKVSKERKISSKIANISEPVNALIDSGFFNDFKKIKDVTQELIKKGISNVSSQNVTTNLRRKLGNGLEREKEGKIWRYKKTP
jgi:hypothetical protein